jgi:hypothetical protein
VTFVSRLLRITSLEAARTIAADFGLAVDERPLSREARRKLEEARRRAEFARELERRFEERVSQTHQEIALLLRTATAAMTQSLARRDAEAVEGLADLLRWLPWMEHVANQLYSRDPERRVEALKEARRWVS